MMRESGEYDDSVQSECKKNNAQNFRRNGKNEESVLLIGGDWYARTGEDGSWINEVVNKERVRKSKDK